MCLLYIVNFFVGECSKEGQITNQCNHALFLHQNFERDMKPIVGGVYIVLLPKGKMC
jgi:hypothetical protein